MTHGKVISFNRIAFYKQVIKMPFQFSIMQSFDESLEKGKGISSSYFIVSFSNQRASCYYKLSEHQSSHRSAYPCSSTSILSFGFKIKICQRGSDDDLMSTLPSPPKYAHSSLSSTSRSKSCHLRIHYICLFCVFIYSQVYTFFSVFSVHPIEM